MTLCPIAIAVGCKKCPAFSVCPLKSVIGDYVKPEKAGANRTAGAAKKSATACSRQSLELCLEYGFFDALEHRVHIGVGVDDPQ